MTEDPNIKRFIGKGLPFPIILDDYGKAILADGYDILKSDLSILMNWPYGTRFFLPEYGTRIEEFLEEPNDSVVQTQMNFFITEAVVRWEKRVTVDRPSMVRDSPTSIKLKLPLRLNNTKLQNTFILPYYSVLNP